MHVGLSKQYEIFKTLSNKKLAQIILEIQNEKKAMMSKYRQIYNQLTQFDE